MTGVIAALLLTGASVAAGTAVLARHISKALEDAVDPTSEWELDTEELWQ